MELKQIKDFPEYYISDEGSVYSDKTNKYKCKRGLIELKGFINKGGYKYVDLVDGLRHKRYGIHQLVASYFIREPLKGEVVDHIDNNKLNNNVKNLQLLTQKNNVVKSYSHTSPVRNYNYYYFFSPDNKIFGPFKGYNSLIKFIKQNNIDTSVYSLQLYGHSKGWSIKKVKKEYYEKQLCSISLT